MGVYCIYSGVPLSRTRAISNFPLSRTFCLVPSAFTVYFLIKCPAISNFAISNNRYLEQKLRESNFEKLDNVLFRWFLSKRSQNIPIDGNLIKEKAIAYAKELGYTNFVGSTE